MRLVILSGPEACSAAPVSPKAETRGMIVSGDTSSVKFLVEQRAPSPVATYPAGIYVHWISTREVNAQPGRGINSGLDSSGSDPNETTYSPRTAIRSNGEGYLHLKGRDSLNLGCLDAWTSRWET